MPVNANKTDLPIWIEIKNNVYVGLRDIVTACDRTEDQGVPNALGLQSGLKIAQSSQHRSELAVIR